MEKEVFTIENDSNISFSLQKAPVKTIDGKTKKIITNEEKIFFLIGLESCTESQEIKALDGYIDISITKNEAERLIETLKILCKSIK